ncbi:hypothetical protein OROGR_007179 [Orobanche gracilis]
MFSTENHLPDPSDNFIGSGDEKASDNDIIIRNIIINNNNDVNVNQLQQFEVDLIKSGLDDINQTLPKFSIRDYVFGTRSKDFKTHWPFSRKNLQLCLKHGVKDVLPPFETLDSVRTPSSVVESADKSTGRRAVKLSGSSNHHLLSVSKNATQKLASDTENIKSNTSEKDKECYPSTTANASCSDVSSLAFQNRSPFLEPGSGNLQDLEKPEFLIRANKLKSISTQNQTKKCRLIVKLSNSIAEQKLNEDSSEIVMVSKVCPVCKTFTSSSNTTLNAHIDQCLSEESMVKCTAYPKVIKHRIKPRKTRLMVDIYETALCCTLEDLDRRNGTNWALNLGTFPAQESEVCDKTYNNENSFVINEDKQEDSAVYFDSNIGTKVRILSRFSDVKSKRNGENDCGSRKLVERDNVIKIVPRKKKHFVERHKLRKCPPYEQRRCSPRLDRCPEVNNAMKFSLEETKKEDLALPLEGRDHKLQSDDSGMIKQWVSFKRTTPKKKKNPNKSMAVTSHVPSRGDKLRTSDLRFPLSCDDNPLLATDRSHKRKEDVRFSSDDECMEQLPCQTNRAGYSLPDSREFYDDKKNHMTLSKSNFKRLKRKASSVFNGTGNHAVSRSNKKTVNVDSPFISSKLSKHHIFSSGGEDFGSRKKTFGGKKLSPLSKNSFSVRHTSVSESAIHMKSNTEVRWSENANEIEKDYDHLSIERARVSRIRKRRWNFLSTDKEHDTSSEHSNSSSKSGSHGLEQNIDSFVTDVIPTGESSSIKVVGIFDEFVCDPISKLSGGEPLIAFDGSFTYDRHCPSDFVLSCEREILCAGQVDVDNEGEGNYFVDPISIPGPPGSFLPSPGRMCSEELQGNSSLTTCRIHSSEDDERELIDRMDSSDSLISDRSFISTSIAARFDLTSPERSHAVQLEFGSDVFENRTGPLDRPKVDESRSNLVIPETKFPVCGDCESPSVVTSNSVLRLMGKNLMVMNKEENISPQTRPTQSSVWNSSLNPRASGVDDRPICDNLSRGLSLLDDLKTCMQTQQLLDFVLSVGSGSGVCSNFETPELSPNLSSTMLSHRTCNERPGSSLECHEYSGRCCFTPDRLVPTVRSDAPIRTSDSYGGRRKEVIVIDDSPEKAPALGFRTAQRGDTKNEGSSVGIFGSRAFGYDSRRHANSFYGYQTPFYDSGSQMVWNANTQVPQSFQGTNIDQEPDGSSLSTGHQRSNPSYFSPGFSLHANLT